VRAQPSTFLGLFLVTLSTLTYELLLTRIFSVTTWYHFAFLAISLAMLGMTVGSILVYLKSNYFTNDLTYKHLSLSAVAFGIAGIIAVLVHIYCPNIIPSTSADTIVLCALLITAPFLLVVFAISGVCVSLALTRFPEDVNKLYAADLIGASLGCFGAVVSLRFVDAICAVFITAAMAALGGLSFSLRADERTKKITLISSLLLISTAATLSYFSCRQTPLLTLGWTKGMKDVPVLLEKWNSFSRIRVMGDPKAFVFPYGYFSDKLPREEKNKTRQLYLDIDGSASTSLPFYDGNPATAKYLEFDPVNVAHFLRPQAKTLIIGIGGGRDVLSSLVMGDKSIVGVEINPNIVDADENKFGDFTGHLTADPRVKIVTDEARSYITHSPDHYDVILASVVDTWAASASGAYSMSENSLYTTDAWATLLKHLNKNGILTMCRFYDITGPSEFYRLTALAADALKKVGVADPRSHIAVVRLIMPQDATYETAGIGAIIVGESPLSEKDVATARQVCRQKNFELALTPTTTLDPLLAKLATGGAVDEVNDQVPWNVAPPSDDNPFFFQTFSIRHLFDPRAYMAGRSSANLLAVPLLMITAISVLFATLYCFRIPFLRTKDKKQLQGAAPFFALFFLIGLGFMFVEISQIQRFTIFLGHPTYGATVVLASLLAATGLGSLVLPALWSPNIKPLFFTLIVLGILVAFGLVSHPLMAQFAGASTPMRICFTIALLVPVGMVLGTLFPASMQLANRNFSFLTPWLWGINGAASVLGSVLAVIAAICANITTSFWLGVLAYLCALLVYCKLRAR